MPRHCENAAKVVSFLQDRPDVTRISHPSTQTGVQAERTERYLAGGAREAR